MSVSIYAIIEQGIMNVEVSRMFIGGPDGF